MTDAEREEVKKKLTALRNSLAASAVAVNWPPKSGRHEVCYF
jgi:hypothetical protein